MKFRGKTENNQPLADWKAIYADCRKHEQFIVEIRKYDPAKEISNQQIKYWHAVPIMEFANYTGYSAWKAEQWLKRECGEQYFMHELKEEENRRGIVMFECLNQHCRDLFVIPKRGEHGVLICPQCLLDNIRLFFMASKTELSTKDFNVVLENTYDFMASINRPIQAPDKNWRNNQ